MRCTPWVTRLLLIVLVVVLAEMPTISAAPQAVRTLAEEVTINSERETAERLAGSFSAPLRARRDLSAVAFIAERPDLFKLNDPSTELKLVREQTDELGTTHIRFDQVYQGLDVWGCQTAVHFAQDNTIYLVAGQTIPTPVMDIRPTLTVAQATGSAMDALAAELGDHAVLPRAKLIIYPQAAKGRLAYLVTVASTDGEPIKWQVFVDAHTGDILGRINAVCTDGPVTGSGTDLFGNARTFPTYQQGAAYKMIDASRSMYVPPVANLKGVIATYANLNMGGVIVTDPNNDNVFTDYPDMQDAVTGHYWTGKAWEYFNSTFGVNSWDFNGMSVIVTVNDSAYPNNAYWTFDENTGVSMIGFSDGDGTRFREFLDPDIVGHEFTHGVTWFSSGLIYSFQSGALNESMSDFFGARIDGSNFLIGDLTVLQPPYCMRSLQDPHVGFPPDRFPFGAQPAHMSEYVDATMGQDNGGVHYNSGIPNRVGYLAVSAIGWEKAEAIWFRCLTTYLTPSSDFNFWAAMLTISADDLYGTPSPEVDAVIAALDSVGFSHLTTSVAKILDPVVQLGTVWDTTIVVRNRSISPVTVTGATLATGSMTLTGTVPVDVSSGQDAPFTVSFDGSGTFDECNLGYYHDTLILTTNSPTEPELRVPLKVLLGYPPLPIDTSEMIATSCMDVMPNNSVGIQRLYRHYQTTTLPEPINGRGSLVVATASGGDTTIYAGWQDMWQTYPKPTLVPLTDFVRSASPEGDSLMAMDFASMDGKLYGKVQYQWEPQGTEGCEYVAVEYWLTNKCDKPLPIVSGMYYGFDYWTDTFFVDPANNMVYAVQVPVVPMEDTAAVGIAMLDGTPRNLRLTWKFGSGGDPTFKPGWVYREMMTTFNGRYPYQYGDFECLVTFAADTLALNETAHYRGAILHTDKGINGLKNIFPKINPSPSSCCVNRAGNIDCDPGDNVDIGDLTAFIDHLFVGFTPLCCNAEAHTDSNPGIDIGDLTALIDNLFVTFTPLSLCQ